MQFADGDIVIAEQKTGLPVSDGCLDASQRSPRSVVVARFQVSDSPDRTSGWTDNSDLEAHLDEIGYELSDRGPIVSCNHKYAHRHDDATNIFKTIQPDNIPNEIFLKFRLNTNVFMPTVTFWG